MPKKQVEPVQPPISSQTTYYNNQQLFSDYFLSTILPEEEAWRRLSSTAEPIMAALKKRFKKLNTQANEAQIEHDWIRPILQELGHTFEVQASLRVPGGTQRPDYVFYASAEQQQAQRGSELDDRATQHGAIAVGDAKQWDQPLDQMRRKSSDSASLSNKNPSFQIFFYMLHSKLPWGILTNGRKWCLYHESTAYKLEVYYEVDLVDLLEAEDVSKFLYFYAFFRRTAFNKGHPLALESILAASVESAQKVREDLSVQVYDALRFIAQGFFDYPQNKLTPTPETCRLIYENSLILLYRMLFILYAESRNLLPIEGNLYREQYSLRAISEQLRRENKAYFSYSGIIWAQLKTLFISIDQGNTTLDINTFDGGLFDSDKVSFLEQYVVGDKSLAQAIDLLATAHDARINSKGYRIDYRDLSERHLGTIYEGLLEYTLHIAEEPMVELRSTSMIVPESQVSNRSDIVRTYHPGEAYLVTDSGQRKFTGSYYTPDYIVKYMVEQTLKPVLDDAVRRHAHEDNAVRIRAILEINVLDPAMGSGHFPVEVVEYIARYLVELGVQPEDKDEHEPDMAYWKRRVVQQCIYGVDANPLAVELAKLSLWLATAAKGYPLNFLDHHLRPGNALIGTWLEDVAGSEHPKAKIAREKVQQQLAFPMAEDEAEATQHSMLEDDTFRTSISSALDVMSEIEQTPANTLEDVKRQEIAYAELRKRFINKYQRLMDLGTALFYNLYIEHRLWRAAAEYAVQVEEQSEGSLFDTQYEQLLQQASTLRKERGFFHWELEFPDIFFNHDGTPRQEAGFDVVIGNPPYVRQERLYADKPFYLDHYEIYHGTADLFVYFFGQGLRLLRPGGRLAYISSNSWLRANYATALRHYLRTNTTVEQIIDLGNTRVFADVPDLSPAIQIVRKQPAAPGTTTKVAIFSRGEQISEFRENLSEERIIDVSLHDQPDQGWQLKSDAARQLFTRLMTQGKPLGELVEGRIYRGILTGLNEAFIIDTATRNRLVKADPACADLIKPMVRGEDLRPWYQEAEGRWLVCLPSGWTRQTFPELGSDEASAWEKLSANYPALSNYLQTFADRARKRQDKGQFWWELRPCDYYDVFEHPKTFWPDMAKYSRFSWDTNGYYCNDKGFLLNSSDQSTLGILQSRIIWFCISQLCAPLAEREGLIIYQQKIQYMERLPIPTLNEEQRNQLATLAQQLTKVARQRYRLRRDMDHRIQSDLGNGQGKFTKRLQEWWLLPWQTFREEVHKSFKSDIPLRERGEWEALLREQRDEIERLTAEIIRLEKLLNAAVYAIFNLSEQEIKIIEQETRYQYGEW